MLSRVAPYKYLNSQVGAKNTKASEDYICPSKSKLVHTSNFKAQSSLGIYGSKFCQNFTRIS